MSPARRRRGTPATEPGPRRRPSRVGLATALGLILAAAPSVIHGSGAAGGVAAPAAATHGTADPGHTTGKFHGCPPEGDGGDPFLNGLKNRDLAPATFEDKTVGEFIEDVPAEAAEMGKRKRANWTEEARAEVAAVERSGVRVEGFLLKVKKEGEESCNCHSADDVDRHMWIAGDPDDDRSESMVVEISPRLLPSHPHWSDPALQKLAKDRVRVRISGWAMWDQEHPEQVGKTRGTLWEIHPIHEIEVFRDGHWKDLDD